MKDNEYQIKDQEIRELMRLRADLNVRQMSLQDLVKLRDLARKWNCSMEFALVRCIDETHKQQIGGS